MNATEPPNATMTDRTSTFDSTTHMGHNSTWDPSTTIRDTSVPGESTSDITIHLTTSVEGISHIMPTMVTTYFRDNFTTSPNTTEGFSQPHDVTRHLFKWHGAELLFLIVVLVLAVVGNMMVIYVYHFRWKRSNFSLFIEVLALLDLINGCTTVPLFIWLTVDDTIHAFHSICQAASYMAMATGVSSGICLLTIAYDRNRKICKPLKLEIPLRLTKRLCSGAVIVGSLIAIPSVFLYGKKDVVVVDEGLTITITECFFTDTSMRSPLLFVFTAVLGLIFTVITVCLTILYISIWKALRIHLQHRESLGSRRSSVSSRHHDFRSQRSSARLFFFVTVAFFSSYFPYFVVMSTLMLSDMPVMSASVKSLTDIAKFSPLLSNIINPIIYSATSTRFRKECLAILFQCGTRLQKRTWKRQGSGSSLRHQKTHTSSVTEEMAESQSRKRKIQAKHTENECSSNGVTNENK
ncbi:opsin Rh4-like [Gigantopelta aegis]|uniref:opsin Rh4-like n=1 Tax=Gigantopelta aegis TaxID=1735272 RepID=UPI001B88C72A|nr:opsin Rh4-like [Gigantopelta aegis]